MKHWPVVFALTARLASAQEAWELFVDKGDTFIRAGEKQGLKVGDELWMYGDARGGEVHGKATVMQVWEALARVSVDPAATKAQAHFARPAGARVAVPIADGGAGLQGRASKSLVGRISLYNESAVSWSNCLLTLPDGRQYRLPLLKALSDDGVMLARFVAPPQPRLDSVRVKCAEGVARFVFKDAAAKTGLKGFAE